MCGRRFRRRIRARSRASEIRTGATRSKCPDRDPAEGDATSVVEVMYMKKTENGDTPDLDAARGLVPAIVIGAAVWAIVFAIAVLLWGCAVPVPAMGIS